MSFLWSLGSFLIAVSILVAVHEFGHFWVARKCGVKVHRFSIGFGKVLWSRKDKYGTEFSLSMIPLGGYVSMLDELNEDVPEELKSQAFTQKTIWQRALIIAAGPIANFLFAIVAYGIIYSVGVPSIKTVIGEVRTDSIAAEAGLMPNHHIHSINGSSVNDWESINMLLATQLGNPQVEIGVSEFGYTDRVQLKVLDLKNWKFDPEKESAFGSLGIRPVSGKIDLKLSRVSASSPAEKAGLQVGDELYHTDTGEKWQWKKFSDQIQLGQAFDVKVLRNGEWIILTLTPEYIENRWFAGVSPTFYPLADEYRSELKYDIFSALWKGAEKTWRVSWLTINVVGKLFSGDVSPKNISGPISIAKGAGESSSYGLMAYLSFMALISVNLGIMNLLPLPVLDGGHLVFLGAEALRGKPISERIQGICYRIGAVLLLILTAFALMNDFLRF